MRPELFRLPDFLGGLPIPAYGVLMILGVVCASALFAWLASRAGAPRGKAFEVSLEMVLVGMIVAKIAGLLLLPPGTPWTRQVIVQSGGVWYFGFLAGVAYLSLRARALGLTPLDALDRMLPASALGHALGRIGCFLAGCCWGAECELPWAVRFPESAPGPHSGVPVGVPLHPTQLYEAAAEIGLCVLFSWWVLRRRRFRGQVALLYAASYAVVRFTLEFFRADFRGSLGQLSTSQTIAAAIFAVTVPLLIVGWRRGGFSRREADDRAGGAPEGRAAKPRQRRR